MFIKNYQFWEKVANSKSNFKDEIAKNLQLFALLAEMAKKYVPDELQGSRDFQKVPSGLPE